MQSFIEGSLTIIVVLKEEAPKQMGPGATDKASKALYQKKKGGAHSESLTTETVMLWEGWCALLILAH